MEKNDILIDMIQKQRKNLLYSYKLEFEDIKRIINNIDKSPFGSECCKWNGYITNGNKEKARYINFYFKHRKIALHRLLYINYIDDINDKQYLKFTCNNKGTCCNINHIEKCNINELIIKEKEKEKVETKLIDDKAAIQVIKIKNDENINGRYKFIIVLSD